MTANETQTQSRVNRRAETTSSTGDATVSNQAVVHSALQYSRHTVSEAETHMLWKLRACMSVHTNLVSYKIMLHTVHLFWRV